MLPSTLFDCTGLHCKQNVPQFQKFLISFKQTTDGALYSAYISPNLRSFSLSRLYFV